VFSRRGRQRSRERCLPIPPLTVTTTTTGTVPKPSRALTTATATIGPPTKPSRARPSSPPGTWLVARNGGPALPQVARASHPSATRSRPVVWPAGWFHRQEARSRPCRRTRECSERGEPSRRERGEVWGHPARTEPPRASLGATDHRAGLKGAARLDPSRTQQAPQRPAGARSAASPGGSSGRGLSTGFRGGCRRHRGSERGLSTGFRGGCRRHRERGRRLSSRSRGCGCRCRRRRSTLDGASAHGAVFRTKLPLAVGVARERMEPRNRRRTREGSVR
jgi:hypothetical protein